MCQNGAIFLKILLLLSLFFSNLFSCALCAQYTPSAHVDIKVDIDDTSIQKAQISWKFSQEFIETIMPKYDKNENRAFDIDEMQKIEKAFVDYIQPIDFLTEIKYYKKDTNSTFEQIPKMKFEPTSYRTYLKSGELYFDYNLTLDYPLHKEYILYFSIFDDEQYMNFIINPLGITFDTPKEYKIIENANMHMLFFDIVDVNKVIEEVEPKKISQVEEKPKQSYFIQTLSNLLAQTTTKMRTYLLDIKYKESGMAFFSLMLFSFAYGIIHALGPGHGKALVSSYFLASNRDVKKAFFISAMIGVVHTFSALILTLVVYFVLNTLMSTFMDQAEYYLTKVSAVIIILMALYLLYRKLPKKPKAMKQWSTHEPTCGCHSCEVDEKNADLGVILGAGLIPCPTTVLIFIFTISLGMYFTGFVSALFMSMGMSVVIFIAAALSVKAREKSEEKFSNLANILSFVGIAIIMILGIMMLLV